MKNIYEVLRQKEDEIQQLQKDIEALRVAARLLADDNDENCDQYRDRAAGFGDGSWGRSEARGNIRNPAVSLMA